jgi:anti-sigma-K factor RskA
MDVKTFIESGILETWVLGSCSPADTALVQQMMKQHPEVKAEIARIEADLEFVANKFAIKPPDALKSQVMQAVQSAAKSNHLPSSGHGLNGKPWLNILLIGLSAAGIFASVWLYQQKSQTDIKLSETQIELNNCQTREADQLRMQEHIALMNDTATLRYQLAPLTSQYAIHATLYSSQTKGRCLISVAGMGNAPSGKAFQLWAIQEGKPVSLGVMETKLNPTDLREVACASGAQAYAVSLEPQGGSATPTEVILMSKG